MKGSHRFHLGFEAVHASLHLPEPVQKIRGHLCGLVP